MADARWVIDRWRLDYKHHRRHSALEYQTPAAFAARSVGQDFAMLSPDRQNVLPEPRFSH
jgi:hypothetical protein